MTRHPVLWVAVVLGVTIVALGAARAIEGNAAASSPGAAIGVRTATIHRATLVNSQLLPGTLQFAPTSPVVNHLAGTYTRLPVEGAVVQPGERLYEVNATKVLLLRGHTPAWRTFTRGMSDGQDVRTLEMNLVELGYARGLITKPDRHFDLATASAVRRWQAATGVASTGRVGFGTVVFEPDAVRVGALRAALGAQAVPGVEPFAATTQRRIVTVDLDVGRQSEVSRGAHVTIDLPSGTSTPGAITEVGTVATAAPTQGGDIPASSITVTVTPLHPTATGTLDQQPVQIALVTTRASHVLAAPIAALLALSEGGYGVEVVDASGQHRLTRVVTGMFADTKVEVSGSGITDGTKVVVAQ